MAAAAAAAQVLDVGPNGSVATYRGSVLVGSDGIRDVQPSAGRSNKISAPSMALPLRPAAAASGLSEDLIAAVAWQESRYRQNAVSAKGARGIMQLMPDTAKSLGVNAADLSQNLAGGSAYLALLLRKFDGDVIKSLAAYNSGPVAVVRHNGVPPYPETKAYVNAILDRMADQMESGK